MADIKFTKNELRSQQVRLAELQKFLPTLQLKKAMLQAEVNEAKAELRLCEQHYEKRHSATGSYSALLNEKTSFDITEAVKVKEVRKRYENIAGIEIPYFESITFQEFSYSLFDTPPWVDTLIEGLQGLLEASIRIQIAQEKVNALGTELRNVSIKVNLFEKILIPRAELNIRKIKVFLGDQQLAAVSQAKVAKQKIEMRKQHATKQRSLQISQLPMENSHAD